MGRRFYVESYPSEGIPRWVVRDAKHEGRIIGSPLRTEKGALERAERLNQQEEERLLAQAGKRKLSRYGVVPLHAPGRPRWVIVDHAKHEGFVGEPHLTEMAAIKEAERLNREDAEAFSAQEPAKAPEPTQEPQESKRYSTAVGIAAEQLQRRQAEAREFLNLAAGRYLLLSQELERLSAPGQDRLVSQIMIEALRLLQSPLYLMDAAKIGIILDGLSRSEHIYRTMVLREKRNADAKAAQGEQEDTLPEELQ